MKACIWSGELYAFPFENAAGSVELDLFWSLYLRTDDGAEQVVVDFVGLPAKVDPLTFERAEALPRQPSAVSYYQDGHCPAGDFSLVLVRLSERTFRAAVELRDIVGCDLESVSVEADVSFAGFIVRPESLDRVVENERGARDVLGRFVDTSRLQLSSDDPFTFVPTQA